MHFERILDGNQRCLILYNDNFGIGTVVNDDDDVYKKIVRW